MNRDSAAAPKTDSARPLLLIGGALITLGVVFIYSQPMTPSAIYLLLTDGACAAAWLAAAIGIGGWIVKLSGVSCASRALFISTSAALGWGVMSLLTLALGLIGAMSQPAAIGLLVVGVILAVVRLIVSPPRKSERSPGDWLWLMLAPLLGLVLVSATVLPGVLWGNEPNGYDVVEYHLQIPREWFELGRIVPLRHNAFSFFPFNVEMHYLLAMHLRGGPWAGMYLAQLMHVAFAAMSVVAVYGIVRQISSKTTGILCAAVVAAVPWMSMLAPIAYNEGGMLLYGTLAIGWTIRAGFSQEKQTRAMIIAGAMAGLACGVKLTAVPMVMIAVPIASLALMRRRFLKPAAVFVVTAAVVLSPWLIRNVAWIGNPVFPEAAKLLGQGHFDDTQVARWNAAHAPREDQQNITGRLAALWEQILRNWRFGYVLLPLAVIVIGNGIRRPIVQFLAILLALQLAIWLGFTHLQSRFFVTAIPIIGILLSQIEWPGWRWCLGGAAVAMGVVTFVDLSRPIRVASVIIGADNYRALMEQVTYRPEMTALIFTTPSPVVLIGEAQAFEFDIPMSRLRYRTVFDITQRDGESAVQAWAGGPIPDDALVVVNAPEVRRLSSTYRLLPPLPPALAGSGVRSAVLRANAVQLKQ